MQFARASGFLFVSFIEPTPIKNNWLRDSSYSGDPGDTVETPFSIKGKGLEVNDPFLVTMTILD